MPARYLAAASCFQPTYEELKHLDRDHLYPLLCRFQPTYEELKHDDFCCFVCARLGFQPTYEELKPLGAKETQAAKPRVSSLPMRN